MTRTRTAGLALLLAALLVAGCGGGGGGEPTVTQTLHDELQTELDAALAELAKEREAKTTAQGEAMRLEGELETAAGNVARLTTELATTEASVTDLTGQLATATGSVTRLTGELETATGTVTRLTAEIGAATDSANANGSLHAQLNAAKAEVTQLETLIGAATDTGNAAGSLYAQLNAANAEVTRLTTALGTSQTALTTAQTRVSTLETLVGDATNPTATSLRGQIAKLTVDLAAEKATVTVLTSQLSTAQTNLTTAQQQAQQAQQQAQEARQEVAEIERQGDVNARGRGVLTLLKTFNGTAWGTAGDPAMAQINDKNTAIEITASPLKGTTRTSGKFYTATLMRTAPGVNQPERKTVVYSDREKSRSFGNHYASSIIAPATVGGTKANPRFQNSTWAPSAGNLDLVSATSKGLIRNPSLGGNSATIPATIPNPDYDSNDPNSERRIANPNTSPAAKMVSTLSATLHGVSGHYGCYNSTTSKACKVTVGATYAQETGTTETNLEVATLTITPETDGVLYFDPGSGSISLLSVTGEAGAPPTTDEEFITFGWWQETPATPDAEGEYTYEAAVFATATGGTYSTATGKAEYQGPAVGLYVDLKSEGDMTIYESGDFTATAILRATFGTGADAGVDGEVTDFKTTHGAKDWDVDLEKVAIGSATAGMAKIIQTGADSTGSWTHDFLQRHDNALPADIADDQPISVTGQFVARIPNVRHIAGAFGAHRTTDPLE